MKMKLSIIIPLKPGEQNSRAVESLKVLGLDRELVEIIKVAGWYPSRQRNIAVSQANGEIVYFLDDDSEVPAGTIERIISRFAQDKVDVVGGPSIPPESDGFLQLCFAEFFASPFGGFNIRHRHKRSGNFRPATERDLISCNLAIKRDVYLKEGGMNESLYPNEENEFLDRLHSKKYRLFYDPDIYVYRSMKHNFFDFFKQIFTYGRGRMEQTLVNPVFIKPYHFVPLGFLTYLFLLPFLGFYLAYFPLLLYVALNLIFSIQIALKRLNFAFLFPMIFVFFNGHLAYGLGSLWGLIKKILGLKRKVPTDNIEVEFLEL